MSEESGVNSSGYRETYAGWKDDPEGFWAGAAASLDWFKPFDKVYDPDAGAYGRWFSGAVCNTCYNAIDRHVAGGRADQDAIIYDSPITGAKRSITYGELKAEVEALAAVLRDRGVVKGDRVLIYMPMVPEAVAMLACRPHRRRSLRRLRRFRRQRTRHPHRRLPAEASSCRPPAASSRRASSPTSRCSMRRSTFQPPNRKAASSCSASSIPAT